MWSSCSVCHARHMALGWWLQGRRLCCFILELVTRHIESIFDGSASATDIARFPSHLSEGPCLLGIFYLIVLCLLEQDFSTSVVGQILIYCGSSCAL